jgi:hypothetical protein
MSKNIFQDEPGGDAGRRDRQVNTSKYMHAALAGSVTIDSAMSTTMK